MKDLLGQAIKDKKIMKRLTCPKCNADHNAVKNTHQRRVNHPYPGTVRSRHCLACGNRWLTIEIPEKLYRELVDVRSDYNFILDTLQEMLDGKQKRDSN